ncbi:SMP-30/gluconolactonase/LRE family protein [Amycolatopsis sp. GM8]|uniref:SMP-30/gluconolactonase/LRE family protein n=1 Tax=Amycolatopsis sp. GM8 TaxID=2896530 RepID=UPI001F26AFF2|nr:SMP-30/gluconolactonase/LRE family protein [Amycolatopsis sp. GM8]
MNEHSTTPVPLLDGLNFAESPRWHDGRLWFSDIFAQRVMAVDETGRAETIIAFEGDERPCGLGFLPDGRLLVVDMTYPAVLRLDGPGDIKVHADLAALAVGGLNDMLVDDQGRAYVGSMGTHGAREPRPLDGDGNIILVEPDGSARIVAEGLDAPNGPCLIDDGSRYVVAEFPAARLTSFDRAEDGSLHNQRLWADLSPGSADGIAADSAGGIWTASPREFQCRRVLEGGEVTDTVTVGDKMPLACAIGGDDGGTLFILSAVGGEARIIDRTCTSVIETVRVR